MFFFCSYFKAIEFKSKGNMAKDLKIFLPGINYSLAALGCATNVQIVYRCITLVPLDVRIKSRAR